MNEDLTKNLPTGNAEILAAIKGLEGRFIGLEERFNGLEEKVDKRLQDTRPIWDKLSADIGELKGDVAELKGDVAELKEGQNALRTEVREIRTHMRDMDRKLSIFNDRLVEIQADYRDIYDRVREMEAQRS